MKFLTFLLLLSVTNKEKNPENRLKMYKMFSSDFLLFFPRGDECSFEVAEDVAGKPVQNSIFP